MEDLLGFRTLAASLVMWVEGNLCHVLVHLFGLGFPPRQVHQRQFLLRPAYLWEERGPVQVQRLQLPQKLRCGLPAV